jgi:acyl-CoA synthetase (AMP-forming)/AMP-acid ligase II
VRAPPLPREEDLSSAYVYRVISQHQRLSYTYERLDRESNAVARGLRELGVAKGSRVAVSLGNNMEYATVRLRFV